MNTKARSPKRKTTSLSLNIDAEIWAELAGYVEHMGVAKQSIAQAAVNAALVAIKGAGGRIVLPIEFVVTHVPAPAPAPRTVLKMRDAGNVIVPRGAGRSSRADKRFRGQRAHAGNQDLVGRLDCDLVRDQAQRPFGPQVEPLGKQVTECRCDFDF